jgi:hypothetical protein
MFKENYPSVNHNLPSKKKKKKRLLGTYFLLTGLTGAIASCRNADKDPIMVHAL